MIHLTPSLSGTLFMFLVIVIPLILYSIKVYIDYYTKYRFKDFINPKKWKLFVLNILRKALKKYDSSDTTLSKSEMINYAIRVSKCYDCLENGSCLYCGCDTVGKFNSRQDTCSNNKWGKFLTDEEMKEYLKKYKLEFNLKITKK